MSTTLTVQDVRGQLEVPEGRPRVEITHEPRTYERHQPPEGRTSYFRDRALAQFSRDGAARDRLERHARELEVDRDLLPKRESLDGLEARVNPSPVAGAGGEFAPPQWIIRQFAVAPRPGQVLQRLIPRFDLPRGVASVNLPRMTAGTATQSVPANAASPSVDVLTQGLEQPVTTVQGTSDWALQALEQSPVGAALDWAVFTDLSSAYDAQVEQLMLTGTGTAEQFTGILNMPGITKVVYGEAAEATKMIPFIGRCLAQVGVKRRRTAEALLMTSSRLAWLGTSEDLQNRPLLLTDYTGSDWPIASLTGVGIYLDDAIPTNLGVSKEQDVLIATRPKDFIYLESETSIGLRNKPGPLLDVLSGTLQVRFSLHTYVSVLYRYPTALSVLEGTGMAVPPGFK